MLHYVMCLLWMHLVPLTVQKRSTEGVARFAPVAAAGPLLAAELDALGRAMQTPEKPMVAIVAGSKVSTKLDVLNSLSSICDQIIVGGGIANTFFAAAGYNVGKSLYEPDLLETAKQIAAKVSVPFPTDVVVDAAKVILAILWIFSQWRNQ